MQAFRRWLPCHNVIVSRYLPEAQCFDDAWDRGSKKRRYYGGRRKERINKGKKKRRRTKGGNKGRKTLLLLDEFIELVDFLRNALE